MYILFLDKRFPSSITRGELLYHKYISKLSSSIKIIDTSNWYNNFYLKISIIKQVMFFFFKNFKKKKYIICLKFTPYFLMFFCRFLGIKIIYDCDDAIWDADHFGIKKSLNIFSLSNKVIFENSFLKKSFLEKSDIFFPNYIINCPLPEDHINKKKDKETLSAFIPTFCYVGSQWHYKEILQLLNLIDTMKLPWNLIILGSTINKSDYVNLDSLFCLSFYNNAEMCDAIDKADIGIYSKPFSSFDKGRGFHKKLIYLSRGLPILSLYSDHKKIISKSHIPLDSCWNQNQITSKKDVILKINIVNRWNSYIEKKFSSIVN
jgi:hypothetical protein